MGEVWRARDTRLERAVAIKVLPAALADNEQLRARFEREAKTISRLNHPHICALFDIGQEDGTSYLVMELLEGESLADRLARGPLPLGDVLRYGAQIADALDRAHRAGIVHRDLKPGNVVITKTGAKLLDFGLAKAAPSPVAASPDDATEELPLTREWTVVGTCQYMAPEQLTALKADARSDIFALGAVLYEMTTGNRAFYGNTRASLIAAIVSSQPEPISAVVPTSPPALDHVVRQCLEKDPDDRWQSAHDVRSELLWIAQAGLPAAPSPALAASSRRRRSLLLAAAVVGWIGLAAASTWALLEWRRGEPARRPLRAEIVLPPELRKAAVWDGTVVISPDGRRLVSLVVLKGERQVLALRDLVDGTVRIVGGTEGATFPFWSPDSAWIGFFAEEKLKRVPAGGGTVQVLCDAPDGRGGTWGPRGDIVFAPDIQGPLMRVSAQGGEPVAVTKVASKGWTHRNPHFLPNGDRFLFSVREIDNAPVGSIAAASVDDSEIRELVSRASNPQFARGWLFFVRDRNLVAQRLDPRALAVAGPVVPIAESIDYYNARDIANFAVSPAGMLAYRQSAPRQMQLAWYDKGGRELATVGPPGPYLASRASGDGRIVAIVQPDASQSTYDIWTLEVASGQLTRATSIKSQSLTPAPSYDGAELAITSGASAEWPTSAFWIQRSAGGRPASNRLASPWSPSRSQPDLSDWSRDGKLLLGNLQEPGTGFDVVCIALDKPGKIERVVAGRFDERYPRLSPDGRSMAYESNETGVVEVFVTDFPAAAHKWQVSKSGGTNPLWSADGRAIYYQDAVVDYSAWVFRGAVHRVALLGTDRLRPGVTETVATPPEASLVAVVGDRFLMSRPASAEAPEPLRLVQNWEALLTEERR